MQRKNKIVFITVDRVSVYGNFKKCCEMEKLPYHSLKIKRFPIILTDIVIHKLFFKLITVTQMFLLWQKVLFV